ncbi:MAG TPA: glycosyltransferase, partial [Ilumatobacteraceae bacterium]|nr:glycosyltransferase [Ilumatobacteraceae bacterium]
DADGHGDFVENAVNGFVVAPHPAAIGAALQRLASDPKLAAELGRRGEEQARTITWKSTITALLEQNRPVERRERSRPRVVALCTYPAHPARHGGQIRINRMLTALAEHVDVHLIALGDRRTIDVSIAPGFTQTTVVRSHDCELLDRRFVEHTQVPCGDIAAGLVDQLGDFDATARAEIARADAVVLCQHYLYKYAREAECLILDAQNVEWQLKSGVYRHGPVADQLVAAIRELEMEAVAASVLVTAVSSEDLDGLMGLQPTLARFVGVPNGGDVVGRPMIEGEQRVARRNALLGSLQAFGAGQGCNRIAVFLGSAHPPNIEAAHLVAATAERMPNVAFVLVGSHCNLLGGRPSASNVIVRGLVEDDELEYLLSACDVALNPVGAGSGTNIKMVDYFASGAPTVATKIGARGLGAQAGQHYLTTAPTEQDLELAIRQVLVNPRAAAERAQRARRLAEHFDWAALGESFAEAVVQVIAEAAR